MKAKRKPAPVVEAPSGPAVLCDRCTRMASPGTNPPEWKTCARCLAGGPIGAALPLLAALAVLVLSCGPAKPHVCRHRYIVGEREVAGDSIEAVGGQCWAIVCSARTYPFSPTAVSCGSRDIVEIQ